ncbi:hypothetical protein LXL04_021786 [Taraxacum kok-saghyz]
MAVVGSVHGGSLHSKFQTLPPVARIFNSQKRSTHHRRPPSPPIFISTNLSDVNPIHLRDLYSSCNQSCHRFPNISSDGRVEPVDVEKLTIALSHSSVVVSVFARPETVASLPENLNTGGDWYRRMIPLTPFSGKLVGFGRAVSDNGLTASIYDVMVIPSLQGRGIGHMILQRIIRLLTNKGIYDIAALCSAQEMDFFKACGFGDDMLGSTTMMYTRSGNQMVKSAEICLISARGLTRTSSLWKLQWFAVGWIDPDNKYCTKVDASGNANPTWKTKFSALIDNSDSNFEDLALNVEVFSRDPVFLKEKLQGTASVGLKEFLDKHKSNSEESRRVEDEVGSFQLRKKNTNKPQGFVDVSIRISQETHEGNSYEGGDEVGIKLRVREDGVNLQTNYPTQLPPGPSYHHPRTPSLPDYSLAGGFKLFNYQPPRIPSLRPSYHQQPPPPPYNVGYMPQSSINLPPSYTNMPSSSGARPGPGFAMGLGAGALAAGAAIFGDDFVSGFDLPSGFTISTDPPF